MNIRLLAITLWLSVIAALSGCVANNPAQMAGGPKYHTLPWLKTEVLGEARPPADLRQKPIWVDPMPMTSLATAARGALAAAGYRVVDRQEDAAFTLRFDGYYRVFSGDMRRQGNLRLDELAKGMEVRWRGGANEPGMTMRTLDVVTDQIATGTISTPSQMLFAATLGAAFEGIAQAAGVRQAISSTAPGEIVPGRNTPLFCSSEEICEQANLRAKHGYQQFVLALDRHDRQGQGGKERATVRVDGIAEGMITDRLLTEAANRLLAMYIKP